MNQWANSDTNKGRGRNLIRLLVALFILYVLASLIGPGLSRLLGQLVGRFFVGVQEGMGSSSQASRPQEVIIQGKERDLK